MAITLLLFSATAERRYLIKCYAVTKGPQPIRDALLHGDDRGQVHRERREYQFGPIRSANGREGRTLNHGRSNNLAHAELTVLDALLD